METIENEVIAPSGENVRFNKILSGAFGWMMLGLLVSAVVSLIVAATPALVNAILGSDLGFLVCIIAELGIVIYLSRRIAKMTAAQARFWFVLYAIVSGLTLSVVFFAFAVSSIISIFFGTALMFGALAIYGAHTKKDLSKIGSIAGFALIGLVVAMLVNLFLQSSTFDLILAWIGVVIFTIFTAYDVQKIKALVGTVTTEEDRKKASVIGALKLYLDFINLFLSLLRIFGRRK